MRFFSWFLIWLVVFKLGLGSIMAMPASTNAQSRHPAVAASACHEHTAPTQTTRETPSKTATAPLWSMDDCHHCCALGLSTAMHALWPATPATPSHSDSQRWNSATVHPGLRPPIA